MAAIKESRRPLNGKCALVTDASAGHELAIAEALLTAQTGVGRAEAGRRFLEDNQPSGRLVHDLDDVAAAVALRCSAAARDITGTVLPVDSGWLAG